MAKPLAKILIIEDDPFLSGMYGTKFELENMEVASVSDGAGGLAAAAAEMPDLILLDIMLPVMDGFEVLKRLKADPKLSPIPVILLTNLNQKEEIERGLSMGAADFLVKAHNLPSEVVKKIKEVLRLKHE